MAGDRTQAKVERPHAHTVTTECNSIVAYFRLHPDVARQYCPVEYLETIRPGTMLDEFFTAMFKKLGGEVEMLEHPPEPAEGATRTQKAASLVKIKKRAARPCREVALHEAAVKLQKATLRKQQQLASKRRRAAPLPARRGEKFTTRGNAIVPAADVAMVQVGTPVRPSAPVPPTTFLIWQVTQFSAWIKAHCRCECGAKLNYLTRGSKQVSDHLGDHLADYLGELSRRIISAIISANYLGDHLGELSRPRSRPAGPSGSGRAGGRLRRVECALRRGLHGRPLRDERRALRR